MADRKCPGGIGECGPHCELFVEKAGTCAVKVLALELAKPRRKKTGGKK